MAQYGIGLSALNAFSEAIDVTSNNIANGQTVGYKSAEYVFADQFFKAQNPQSRDRAGMGTSRMIIRRANTYGTISGTQNPLDLAIAGPGMFILAKHIDANSIPTETPQKFQYTRNGQFAVDADNRIVNENGLFLVGYGAQDGIVNKGSKSILKLDTDPLSQVATSKSTINLNIDNRAGSLAGRYFDPKDPASYSQSTSQTIYDSKGASHTLSVFYKKTNTADLEITDYDNTGTTFKFLVSQPLGTTLNGEQTNLIATTAVPSTVTGATQTIENAKLTYLSGGVEDDGGIVSLDLDSLESGGTDYIDGIYKNVALSDGVGGDGDGAFATVTVSGGEVTNVKVTKLGSGYSDGDTVSGTFGDNYSFSIDISDIKVPDGIETVNTFVFPDGDPADGVYTNVSLTGADDGRGSKATITVKDGVVTSCIITKTGTGYADEEVVSGKINGVDFTAEVTGLKNIGESNKGALYNLKLIDGTTLVLKQTSLSNETNVTYEIEVDRYAVFATINSIPVGASTDGTGKTTVYLDGDPNDEQTSLGTMAFVAGKNIDSLSRDGLGKPQFLTKLQISAGGLDNKGDGWGQTSNGGAINFDLFATDTTGYASSAQTYVNSQDGSPTSQLSSYSFDSFGRLVAQYDNGKSVVKGQLILATFNNFEGLIPVGGNAFMASPNAGPMGQPTEDTPNGSQMGAIRSQAVEESNVDLTQQLVKLMVLQRAYSAASQATKVQVATLVDDTLRIGQ